MKEQYFDIQDRFLERMKADFEAGMITNPVFKPYFQWKLYGTPLSEFTPSVLREIAEACSDEMERLDEKYLDGHKGLTAISTLDDIWKPYACYGEDKYLYSYLSAIDSEVSKLMLII